MKNELESKTFASQTSPTTKKKIDTKTENKCHNEEEVKRELAELGVDVLLPLSPRELQMADAFEAFSHFVLFENAAECQSILEKYMGKCVGALQGGSDSFDIYRVAISLDHDEDHSLPSHSATYELIHAFHSWYPNYANYFTTDSLKLYMLGICAQRGIKKLGNLMFIMSFGPVVGQVRHIDNMVTNVQICLYMSNNCPSTIIYSLEDPIISNTSDLIQHWETKYGEVPNLLSTLLHKKRNFPISKKWYTKYYRHWESIDVELKCFGKLYQTVLRPLALTVQPGTTLVAGGNDVHAGPPTNGPRMFAFAIGVPDDEDVEEENDGEVQYSPVLFHVDLCCILFAIMDYEYGDQKLDHQESKIYLLNILRSLVQEYPKEPFGILLDDERKSIREWLVELVLKVKDKSRMKVLLKMGVQSDDIFFSPDVIRRRQRKKRKPAYK